MKTETMTHPQFLAVQRTPGAAAAATNFFAER